MRFRAPWLIVPLAIVGLCASVSHAWEQLDYDIFDLVDDVRKIHGEEATFYSVLGVDPTAEIQKIVKAHRKLSLAVHPDKNPSAEAEKAFTQLGAITEMLKVSERRERYDFYLKNGVPSWRGTGYYYKRHRPGLTGVLVMLALFGSAVHYLLLYVGWVRGKQRWQMLQAEMRPRERKGKQASWRPPMAVQGYLVTAEGDWPAEKPSISSVFVIALPVWLVMRAFAGKAKKDEAAVETDSETESASNQKSTATSSAPGTPRTMRRRGGK